MAIRVKRDTHSNNFCGPAALSLLTGRHVDDCVWQLRLNRRINAPLYTPYQRKIFGISVSPAIKGVRMLEMVEVIEQWGFKWEALHMRIDWPRRTVKRKVFGRIRQIDLSPTLVQFLRMVRDRTPEQRFLLVTKDHYLVLRGRKLYDNKYLTGVFIRQYPHRRTRIWHAFLIP